jgi:predicted ArsR family transcriptional regulator
MTWDRRFLASTRGRIVGLLRRGGRTVDELAAALALTDNAVRAHLATLERDGLVRQEGARRGAGKPAYTYGLTPDAERTFPRAYEPVLRELLGALGEQLAPGEVESLLRATARRLAAGQAPSAGGDARARAAAAVDVLNALGGLAELEEGAGGFVIRSYGCPLAAVVPGHPEVCRLAAALVGEVAGAATRECCVRDPAPRCCFEFASA